MNFQTKLKNIAIKNNSLVCIGLDGDIEKIPQHLKSGKNPQFTFNKEIIEATYDLVCAYKPNIAFYEAEGLTGLLQLKFTVSYLRKKYPEIPIILDAKRADIGNTNEGYVKFAFDFLEADAITVNPYLGKETLKPFLDCADKGVFVLCRTSNPGAGEFQDLLVSKSQSAEALAKEGAGEFQNLKIAEKDDNTSGVAAPSGVEGHDSPDGEEIGKPLYQVVAEHVVKKWNYNNNCGLVVGATYPTELEIVRRIVGSMPILIPGIGAQGGDVEKTVKAGVDKNGQNAIINSSRGIIFASPGEDFAKKAREEAEKLRSGINKYRQKS